MSNKKQTLVIQAKTPDKVQTYEINKSEFVFGRSGKAEVAVNDNGISREHIRFQVENDIIKVLDLGSLNGTYIDGYRIVPNEYVAIQTTSQITFGNCNINLSFSFKEFVESAEVAPPQPPEVEAPPQPEYQPEPPQGLPILTQEQKDLIDLSAFPKKEEDFRLDFKNVGLDLPKYKNPGEHAKEMISEAMYQKHAIIRSAEVFKSKTINDTRILAKKASDEAYAEYKRLIDHLLDETRKELNKVRIETEMLLDEKRIQANTEIQALWSEHETLMRAEKGKLQDQLEKDNQVKIDLMVEKMRSDMFSERHKIITEAETENIQKRHALNIEMESEKTEHSLRLKLHKEDLQKTLASIEEHKAIYKDSKALRDQAELDLSKTLSELKVERENLASVTLTHQENLVRHLQIESELNSFNETKSKALAEIAAAHAELQKINTSFSHLTEKKQKLDEEIAELNTSLNDQKARAKAEIEEEYNQLKRNETKKFEDFKANELKELQKIRDHHAESVKNFSVDLSQEIATKLELLSTKNGIKFDFEKNFELINSVIQVKSSANTGSESKHSEQLENWKNRKRKEDLGLLTKGFAAALVVVFLGYTGYRKLNVDPLQEERSRIAAENREKDAENTFTPVKTDKYYVTYVDSTLYTDGFSEAYLDKKNQQEWVNYATKYFLKQWKVEEEKVIKVISNSNALVQNVNETIPNLKKSKLKADLAKLKELEDEYVKNQASILGTNVKYEAYKKLEKDFFQQKMLHRQPANQ
jgi:pSer/pThr/pTyr-binding forkhead associated (FHA) protein